MLQGWRFQDDKSAEEVDDQQEQGREVGAGRVADYHSPVDKGCR